MHLLDTDMLTHFQRGHPRVIEARRALSDPQVGITVITWIEVTRGRCDALLKAANATELTRAQTRLSTDLEMLEAWDVAPVNQRAAAIFADLRTTKGLKKIGRGDLLIASIALAHDAVLVTRNLKHFRQVPRLKLANWVD